MLAQNYTNDISKAVRALNPYQKRDSLPSFAPYAINKFRNLSRQLEADG